MRYFTLVASKSFYENILIISFALLLGGCGANFHSIFRVTDGDENKIAFTDAKQAATIIKMDKDGVMKACAAKSPDVFQALSTAFSGNLSAEEAGGIAAKIAGAGSSAESSASYRLHTQLTDTQNELLYQLCVNSLNGTITGDQLATELHRYQNTMVTMLAIEQLTGYARPTIVALGGSKSKTGAAEDVASIQSSLDAARANEDKLKAILEKANKTASDKQTAYDTAKKANDAATDDTTKKSTQAALTKASDELAAAKIESAKYDKLSKEATDNRKGIEAAREQVLTDLTVNSSGAMASFNQPSVATIGTDANTASQIAGALKQLQEVHLHQTFTSDECLSFLFHSYDKKPQNAIPPVIWNKLEVFCEKHLQEVNKYKIENLYLSKGCSVKTTTNPNWDGKNRITTEINQCLNPAGDPGASNPLFIPPVNLDSTPLYHPL